MLGELAKGIPQGLKPVVSAVVTYGLKPVPFRREPVPFRKGSFSAARKVLPFKTDSN